MVAGGDYLNLLLMYASARCRCCASEMSVPEWIWDRAVHLVLPVVCLTYASLSYVSRYSRVSMLDALGQDFDTAAAPAERLPEYLVSYLGTPCVMP